MTRATQSQRRIFDHCSVLLEEIQSIFKKGVRVTLVIRDPEDLERFAVMGDDLDYYAVSALIRSYKSREPVIEIGDKR